MSPRREPSTAPSEAWKVDTSTFFPHFRIEKPVLFLTLNSVGPNEPTVKRPVATKSTFRIEQGNNLDVLKKLIAQGVLVDSVVTDPPYALNFMCAKWDAEVPSVEFWKLIFQILKPGGHLLAFGGTRTYHRLVVNIEDAGFEVRDMLSWVHGSGMAKGLDISKAIDNAAGAERKIIGTKEGVHGENLNALSRPEGDNDPNARGCGAYGVGAKQSRIDLPVTAPATPEAIRWEGWKTGLKPAMEPIVLARKPLSEGTVAANVLKHSTGALNIDACRIPGAKPAVKRWSSGLHGIYGKIAAQGWVEDDGKGRWPRNSILDEEAAALLDEQTGRSVSQYFKVFIAQKPAGKSAEIQSIRPLNPSVSCVNWLGWLLLRAVRYSIRLPDRERPAKRL